MSIDIYQANSPSEFVIISRKEAKQRGSTHYYTGKPCKRGHIAQRRTGSGACIECDKLWRIDNKEKCIESSNKWRNANPEYYKQFYINNIEYYEHYYLENKERISEYQKQYYIDNRAHLCEYTKHWANNNLHKVSKYSRKWRKNNPQKIFEYTCLRNTVLEQAIPNWLTDEQYEEIKCIYEEARWMTEMSGINFEVDHIIPLNPRDGSVCGLHVPWNLRAVPKMVNNEKSDSYQKDW